jgi:hypothetical protein
MRKKLIPKNTDFGNHRTVVEFLANLFYSGFDFAVVFINLFNLIDGFAQRILFMIRKNFT